MLQKEMPSQREATTQGVEQTPDVKSVVDLVLYAMFVQTVKEDVDLNQVIAIGWCIASLLQLPKTDKCIFETIKSLKRIRVDAK